MRPIATIESSIVIKRPVEEVFAFTTNFENQPKWQSRLLEVKKTSEGPIGVGTTWHAVAMFLGQRVEVSTVITEYEANRTYAGKYESGPAPAVGRLSYEPVEEGTRMTFHMETQASGFFKLTEPLMTTLMKRTTESDLATLKDLMEAGAFDDGATDIK
ncbi:MAG TPA: SRPBCC family protein [Candidatus Limnocylindrales bacterium]|nr:SRPBCC family protein [Candidatus Limnocylindrales bacterium]